MDNEEDPRARVKALLKTGPYPILTTDQDKTIHDANPPAHCLFGYFPPHLQECPLDDLIPDLNDASLNAIHTGQHSNGTTFPLTVHRSPTRTPKKTLLWLQDLRKLSPPFDVGKTLQAALEHLTPIQEQRNAFITHDALPPAPTHPPQLENILTTILTHAIQHTPARPPRVHITAEQIPHETRYALITNLPRPRNGSTSPGLTACRRILKAHGGDLTLQPPDRSSLPPRTRPSEIPPGQGAMFLITLPSMTSKIQRRAHRARKDAFPRQTTSWRGQP